MWTYCFSSVIKFKSRSLTRLIRFTATDLKAAFHAVQISKIDQQCCCYSPYTVAHINETLFKWFLFCKQCREQRFQFLVLFRVDAFVLLSSLIGCLFFLNTFIAYFQLSIYTSPNPFQNPLSHNKFTAKVCLTLLVKQPQSIPSILV